MGLEIAHLKIVNAKPGRLRAAFSLLEKEFAEKGKGTSHEA